MFDLVQRKIYLNTKSHYAMYVKSVERISFFTKIKIFINGGDPLNLFEFSLETFLTSLILGWHGIVMIGP